MQLEHRMSDFDDRRQRAACSERYRRRDEPEDSKRPVSEIDAEIEEECRICMELNSRVVLRNCSHDMCIKCYHQRTSLMEFPKCPTPTATTCTTRRMMASSPTPTPSSPTPGHSPVHKSASSHGGSADAASATKEEEGSGGLPATVCLARADGRRMPARIRRLRPQHPQGGAATITYPTMGQ